ncbi:hypothetical protein Moror_6129 [Moniliophthora roreri MCA 2997]|uniref:Uncharacterized protein n=1 Tax=Moniliophthora roreri (strain MCA 2997) TaxID=1381753 RepID=V2XYP9_MONRO|nr:hypothetical protein Moror_6129 [Moniliophthora roreri MCA 2997]
MKFSLIFSVSAVASIVVAVPVELFCLAGSKPGDLAVTDEEYAYPGEKQQRDVEPSSPLEGEYAYPSKVRRVEDDKDVVVDVEFTYSGKKQL